MTTIGESAPDRPAERSRQRADEPAERADAHRPYVIVVDDSAEMRTMLREVLEPRYEMVTAGSSGRALTLMAQVNRDRLLESVDQALALRTPA